MKPSNIVSDIQSIISEARQKAVRSVNFERVMMYWKIGERIFEEEQKGEERAEYGVSLIKNLSKRLKPEYGSGFSARNLEMMRLFYRTFPKTQTLSAQLSWSHYTLLLSIEDQDQRAFYIAETKKNNWSVRQLER